MLKQGH